MHIMADVVAAFESELWCCSLYINLCLTNSSVEVNAQVVLKPCLSWHH